MDSRIPEMERHNRLPILSLVGANAISLVGNQLTNLAVPWFVLQTTGSATKTGLTAAVTVLPIVLAGFFGGTLVDRIGHKNASVLSDVASGTMTALIPLLFFTVGLPLPLLLLLVFLGNLLDVPGGSARLSLIPELTARAAIPLDRVNSAYESITRGAQLVGPLLAGLLIGTLGAANVLWIDAATFMISALMIAALVPASASRFLAS